jgi:hypothetical protein
MSMRKALLSLTGRGIMSASLTALVLTMAEPPFAAAGQLFPAAKGVSASISSPAATSGLLRQLLQ